MCLISYQRPIPISGMEKHHEWDSLFSKNDLQRRPEHISGLWMEAEIKWGMDKSLETIPSSPCVREPAAQRQYEFLFVLENAPQMFDARLRVGERGWGETKQTAIKVVCESV